LTLSFLLQPLAATVWQYGLALLLAPIGTALLFPPTSSLVTRFAERHEIGTVMGVQQTFGGVARLIAPLWAGLAFQELGISSPFFLGAAITAVTFVFVLGLEPPAAQRAPAAVAEAEPSLPTSG
jgi:MFS family permease